MLTNIWHRLTVPDASSERPGRSRQARLLTWLLAAFILLTILLSVAIGLSNATLLPQKNPDFYTTLGVTAMFAVAYALNRTGRYTLAAFLTVTTFSAIILAATAVVFSGSNPYYEPDDVNLLVSLVIPVLFASILLSVPTTAIVVILNIAGMVFLSLPFPQVTLAMIASGPLAFLLAVSALILLAAHHRNQLERDRQARLAESEERHRLLFENVTDVVYSLSPTFEVLSASPSVERILGYKPEDLTSRPFQELNILTSNSMEIALSDARRVLAGEQVTSSVYEFVAQDGTRKFGEVSGAPLVRNGEVVAVVSVARDITERKQVEKALRESKRCLEETLAELRDTQEQMIRQERLAAVGQLAAGIAHDFRNLLTTIILYASMAQRQSDLPPKMARNLETIIDESIKAADLVQQILDFSSRAMIERRPLNLASLTREVLNVLRRTIPENVQLSLKMAPEEQSATFTVQADPGRIQQALTNLATNARDAMPGGGELCFELSRFEITADEAPPVVDMEPGAWVCLAVSDTGTGMTEEVQSHLFEPFFTTKEVDKGTGLGLAQVYGIVRQHEGYIDVSTEMGKGATFRIYLPACEDEMKESEAAESAAPLPGHGERVLLVEDNRSLREAAQGILESLGYRVLTAANGREALEVYEAEDGADLVITDLVMPEMGGKELMQMLTRSNPDLKALGITGYAVNQIADELRNIGFLDVVHKPFEVEELARAIHRALSANTAGRTGGEGDQNL